MNMRKYFTSAPQKLTMSLNILIMPIAGDVSLSSSECSLAGKRHACSRTFPAVYEVIALRSVPAAPYSRTHLPRRQARAVRGESNPCNDTAIRFVIRSLISQIPAQN